MLYSIVYHLTNGTGQSLGRLASVDVRMLHLMTAADGVKALGFILRLLGTETEQPSTKYGATDWIMPQNDA